ncbi:hypothetical protein Agabi119p4_5555 [Agaricus bisporus var. burnettii]|uniref:SH3 domain-containing protein n=1 Tax=Agaricus bisporus var. burnettii TaxID=192524 RepID=A0A8H7F1W3_AGABI|nr:hypothetical protein Agabi119p4_5555 [Agaricus bisporus var. burnettii]
MTFSHSQDSALLAHIVSQVENNIQFLVSQGHIAQKDASQFLVKLPRPDTRANVAVPSFPAPTPHAVAPTPVNFQASPAVTTRARALWAWSGQDESDLSIKEGDVIEIVEETNGDWWTGRLDGRQGVFPANFVEKIKDSASTSQKPVYKPFRAAYHGMDQPSAAPAPAPVQGQTNSLGLEEDQGQQEKKSKYGGLKNTMAHSAAGGVGFGAGAAIGGGLVRAIF